MSAGRPQSDRSSSASRTSINLPRSEDASRIDMAKFSQIAPRDHDQAPPSSTNVIIDVPNYLAGPLRPDRVARLEALLVALEAFFGIIRVVHLFMGSARIEEFQRIRIEALLRHRPEFNWFEQEIDEYSQARYARLFDRPALQVVVVSGDREVAKLLTYAQDRGCSAVVVSAAERTSMQLRSTADRFVSFEDLGLTTKPFAGNDSSVHGRQIRPSTHLKDAPEASANDALTREAPPRADEVGDSPTEGAEDDTSRRRFDVSVPVADTAQTHSSSLAGVSESAAVLDDELESHNQTSEISISEEASDVHKSDAEEPSRDHVSLVVDNPLTDIGLDELGRRSVARALEDQIRTLTTDHPHSSFLIHIDGPWGAGKSTLMHFVGQRVTQRATRDDPWLVINYDAWRQAKAGPPWLTLLEALRSGVRSSKRNALRRIAFGVRERSRLIAHWQWFAAGVALTTVMFVPVLIYSLTAEMTMTKWGDLAKIIGGALPVLAAVWVLASGVGRLATLNSNRNAAAFLANRNDPMEDLALHFRWVLKQARHSILLLVDDLDRCSETQVVELLETIQKLLRDQASAVVGAKDDRPNLIILVAGDGRWIRGSYDNVYSSLSSAVGDPGSSVGGLFLQKLFQLTVPVPRMSNALRAQYIANLLSDQPKLNPAALPVALARQIGEAESSSEVLDVFSRISELDRLKVADLVIDRLVVDKDEQKRTRHVLEPFAALVDSTPRSLKRYVMAYSMLRAVRTAEGSAIPVAKLALWTALVTRWPSLGDYLQRYPEAVDLFKTRDEGALKEVPANIQALFRDPPADLRAIMNHERGPLDARNIRECSGQ